MANIAAQITATINKMALSIAPVIISFHWHFNSNKAS